jgi:lipoprotein-anchoring transpeptidase ErfK/SrfK
MCRLLIWLNVMARSAFPAIFSGFALAATLSLGPQIGRTDPLQRPVIPSASTVEQPASQILVPLPNAEEASRSPLPSATRVTLLNPQDPTVTQPTKVPEPSLSPTPGDPALAPTGTAAPETEQSLPTTPLTEVVLHLRERYLYVKRDGTVVAKFPVAIGAPETPTPKGTFQVRNKLKDPVYESTQSGRRSSVVGPSSPIGDRWIGFHAKGNDQFGFHGTPWPYWVDVRGAVSHGCVRLKNEHARKLFELVAVGDTVRVTD